MSSITMRCPPPFKLPFVPRQIVVFAGHIVDAPDRPTPRFPPSSVDRAGRRIEHALKTLGIGPRDIGLTQGAAGGDILFAEACRRAGAHVQLLLPTLEDEFIATSVLQGGHGNAWHQRYLALKPPLASAPCVMPQSPGARYERCNAWMPATAVASGAQALNFMCLWDGEDGDGPGGTAHMMGAARGLNASITWIDTRTLDS